ncbi:hypothetical protein ACS3SW_15800 [Roseobacteraceae bacterium S113]
MATFGQGLARHTRARLGAPIVAMLLIALAAGIPASAFAGNEDFAAGNCTSPGRNWPTLLSVLEFQKYDRTSAIVLPQTTQAFAVAAALGPLVQRPPSGFDAALASAAPLPLSEMTAHFLHREGISLTVTQSASKMDGLVHVVRRCAFFFTPEARQTTSFGQLMRFGPMFAEHNSTRASTASGRMQTVRNITKGAPAPTELTGKGGAGGHMWMVGFWPNDTATELGPHWVPGSAVVFTELSDFLRPEDYRTD